jgi:hypothetical protein
VHRDEESRDQRNAHAVKDVETEQGRATDRPAADQGEAGIAARVN